MKRTQIYLPQDLYAQLQIAARQEKTSVSDVIREKLNKEIGKQKKHGANVLLELAEIGKKWKIKAPKDLASNLDYYLYGQGSPEWGYLYKNTKKSKKTKRKFK